MAKPWRWKNTLRDTTFGACEAAQLIDGRGRNRCTVWSSGVWHTWNERGVGGENSTAASVQEAKEQATAAVLRQGWAVLVAAPSKRAR